MFHLLYQTPVVHTRVFMCYGKGQPDWKIIPYAISRLQCGEVPQVTSGDRQVDWVYAPDVAQGLLMTATAPGLEGHSVDIGSGQFHTIREVVEILQKIVNPDVRLDFSQAAPRAYEQVKKADAKRTEQLTSWRAKMSLEEGLRLTVQACLGSGSSSSS
jgi:nucleoside-diphosphate-sugar epimerase